MGLFPRRPYRVAVVDADEPRSQFEPAPVQVTLVDADGQPAAGTSVATTNGDGAAWLHGGAPNGDSGSFDFVADQTASAGTCVTVDDSEDWVTDNAGWGYPCPVINEAGIYTIALGSSDASAAFNTGVKLLDNDGNDVAGIPGIIAGASQRTAVAESASFQGYVSITVAVPEGTHVDLNGIGTTIAFLTIQKTGDVGPDFI